MAGVLHGLHAAHEARDEQGAPLQIVHRDVSPQNVLVGVDGTARVLDFGVAKAAGRIQTTREGQLKGKIAYMAPEQIRGVVDRTTDVYAASVVCWEALTAKRLFHGESEVEVMGKVLDAKVPPPSAYVEEIPPALEAIILRGLDRDPAKRFQTAGRWRPPSRTRSRWWPPRGSAAGWRRRRRSASRCAPSASRRWRATRRSAGRAPTLVRQPGRRRRTA